MEPLNPQQLGEDGQAEFKNGDYLSAAGLFKAAADGYSITGDELNAAEMLNNCSVAYQKAGDAEAAFEAVKGTDIVFAANGDIKRQAMSLGNRAGALEQLNRFDEAIEVYKNSAELLGNAGENELRAYVYQSISSLQLRQHRFLEAYASMHAGVLGIKKPNTRQRFLKFLLNVPYKLFK
jgi:tetratricopeptide (TPR) repeat protein